MRDFSINLPTWAIHEGYILEGGMGTYDELFLYKGFKMVKMWGWLDKVPNIFELEELINEIESEEIKP